MNTALAARLALESGVTVFDVYSLQNAIVANPASFGLTNVTDAIGSVCNPATSLFWDGIHPTSAGHAILAQGMLAVVAVPEPEEYALLVAGSLLVAWRTSAKRRGHG
jgi:outer membrane lipase/esterase